MQRVIQGAALILIIAAITSCGSNSNSGQQTKAIEVSTDEACHRKYVSVKMDTFEKCLTEGLTYVQVANTLGYAGTLLAQSSNAETWQWNSGEGKYLTVTFVNGQLVSKSQINLE